MRFKWVSHRRGVKVQLSGDWSHGAPPWSLSLWAQRVPWELGLHEPLRFYLHAVSNAEMQALNLRYRGRDAVTNILAFPFTSESRPTRRRDLGELVVAPAWVIEEASSLNKVLDFHWAHLMVHGLLHLLGYDHEQLEAAQKMEQQEACILKALGFPSPYSFSED